MWESKAKWSVNPKVLDIYGLKCIATKYMKEI